MSARVETGAALRASRRPSRALDGFVIGVLLLALGVVAAAVFLVALGLAEPAQLAPNAHTGKLLFGWIGGQPGWARAATAGVALLVGLGSLGALAGRLRTGATGTADGGDATLHLLISDERGVVFVSREGIEGVARAGAASTPRVAEVQCRVKARGQQAVGLQLRVLALPGAALDRIAQEARERAVRAVEELAGFEVRDASVRIDVIPPDRLGEGVLG